MPNPNFDEAGVLSTTIDKYLKKLEEQIFTSKVLTWALTTGGSFENESGGVKIVQPLMYAGSVNVGSYKDDDVFKTDPNTGITSAEYIWKQYYGLMHFTGIEDAMNSGPEAILNLIKTRADQLEMTMSEDINNMLYRDGTGNDDKDFDGLDLLIGNGEVGNIDGAVDTWWASQAGTAADNAALVRTMRTLYNDCSEGNDHPSIVVATQNAFEAYEDTLVDQIRYTDTKMGDAGFENLMYKQVPIAFDVAAMQGVTGPAGRMFFLNLKYLKFKKLAGKWFVPSPVEKPINQDVYYKSIKSYGNFVVSNRKRQGLLTLTDSTPI